MKKIILLILLLVFSACAKEENTNESKEKASLEPLVVEKYDYDTFTIKGKNYKLPASFEEFRDNGLSLNKNEYYKDIIGKNQHLMTSFLGDGYNIGVTFKNPTSKPIKTEDAEIIEIYVNSSNNKNKDFKINNISWGTSFDKAKDKLKAIKTEENTYDQERTINYYTDKNYVTLHFTENKLTSAAIFSKAFMRDENYVGGEFVIYGQTVKFPLTTHELEDLLASPFDVKVEDDVLRPGEELSLATHTPIYMEDENEGSTIDLTIKNTTDHEIYYKDADIVRIKSSGSSDISVGNVFVGAENSEIKLMDKKNQNPPRLNILEKEGDLVKVAFEAENKTQYIFYMDRENIKQIEIIKED